jgi:hypothetical protein
MIDSYLRKQNDCTQLMGGAGDTGWNQLTCNRLSCSSFLTTEHVKAGRFGFLNVVSHPASSIERNKATNLLLTLHIS